MPYLVAPSNGSDFARLYVEPTEKCSLYFTEAEISRNSDDTGFVVFGKCWAISAEYRGKDDATIEKFPYVFFELHDKQWEKTDWRTKQKSTIEPTPIEQFLYSYLSGNNEYNSGDFTAGFKGKISVGDYATLIEMLPDVSEEKRNTKLLELVEVEPVELSEEFKGKKKPAIGTGGNKSGYRGSSAQKEAERLNDRATFLATFLDPDNASGIYSDQPVRAMSLIYPMENETFKPQHYRNYIALVLGGNSVV